MARLNLGSVDLGDFERDWFIVMSRLRNTSTRGNASAIIEAYVKQNLDEYKERLAYTARKYGLTEEECFNQILTNPKFPETLEE
jgi:hypothetical protein